MKLSVVSANSYDKTEIDQAVDTLFYDLGGAKKIIGDAKSVFIKVNLVREMSPEKCATTHPEVVRAVAKKIIDECGCQVVVGDSSIGAYNLSHMSTVYRATKMDYACEESGATLNNNFDMAEQNINGYLVNKMPIISAFTNADKVINIGKLKTHSFTGYTGCVKNLYGLIPGLVKVETHAKYTGIDEFVDCLLDIERYTKDKICLHILDAVMGMEGEGPTNGKPKFIGKIIGGEGAYMVDMAGVSLFAEPKTMPIISRAISRGIIPQNFESEFDFSVLKNERIGDFKKVDVMYKNIWNIPPWLRKFAKNALCPKVKPNKKVCKGCGRCVTHCPAQAITINSSHIATVNQSKCIRCYCCQELCPHNAVILVKPLAYKVVRKFSRGKGNS